MLPLSGRRGRARKSRRRVAAQIARAHRRPGLHGQAIVGCHGVLTAEILFDRGAAAAGPAVQPSCVALLDVPGRQLAGRGLLAASVKYRLVSPRRGRPPQPRPALEPDLAAMALLPYALAELARNSLALVWPSRYFATRAEAFAAGALLDHDRWVVADVTVRAKRRADYEYCDAIIKQMAKAREELNNI